MNWSSMRKMLLLAVLGFVMVACDYTPPPAPTHKAQQAVMEDTARRMITAVPPPVLEFSLERENIRERYERFSDRNKVSYIYLMSYGRVVAFYTVLGKVSSVNSYMTPMEQIVDDPTTGSHEVGGIAVEAPSLDGTYGTNGEAIFFFTTENVYVEWNGEYMLADQPLSLTVEPMLVRQIE